MNPTEIAIVAKNGYMTITLTLADLMGNPWKNRFSRTRFAM
jgi:hypothetical protein